MMDLEVQANKTCNDCFHFISDGDRCDLGIICFKHSVPCSQYEEVDYDEISDGSS